MHLGCGTRGYITDDVVRQSMTHEEYRAFKAKAAKERRQDLEALRLLQAQVRPVTCFWRCASSLSCFGLSDWLLLEFIVYSYTKYFLGGTTSFCT